jgi:CheY-like chemotaxis protein
MSRSAALQIERPAPDPRTIESSLSFHSPKMLIVDDDPSVLRLLANHCTRLGFDVETATNGMQALLKASRIQPKILVIDVNLPELDGLSACAHLLGPDRSPVDVIVITGSRGSETPERCEGFGAYYAHNTVWAWLLPKYDGAHGCCWLTTIVTSIGCSRAGSPNAAST